MISAHVVTRLPPQVASVRGMGSAHTSSAASEQRPAPTAETSNPLAGTTNGTGRRTQPLGETNDDV